MKLFAEKNIRKVFDVGVILKGIDGVFEIAGGLVLLLVSPAHLNTAASFLTAQEVNLSGSIKYWTAAYLLTHGVVKIVLVVGLLRNKLWAYPAAIAIFAFFALYQMYYLIQQYSLGLVALTILDVIVILLTWHEYKYISKKPIIS